jgi:hypothetical protein
MKKCERRDCGSWTNIMYENKCKVTITIPEGECPYFMDKIEKSKIEKYIRRANGKNY